MQTNVFPGLRQSLINIASTWGVRVGSVLFAFVSVPLITARFGLEGLSLWLLIQQASSHLQLFELGINTALGRFLARDLASQNAASHEGFLSSAIVLLTILAVLTLVVGAIFSTYFSSIFELPPSLSNEAWQMMMIAGAITALSLPLRTGIGLLSSRHRFDVIAKWEGWALIIKSTFVLLICLTDLPSGLVLLVLAVFLPSLFRSLQIFRSGMRIPPASQIRLRSVTKHSLQLLLGVSLSAMVVTAAAVVLRQGSPMLVGAHLGITAVPLLALPLLVVTSLGPFIGIASKLISPVASQLDAIEKRELLLETYQIATRYALALAGFVLCTFIISGRAALTLWLGEQHFSNEALEIIYLNTIILLFGYCLAVPAFLGRSVIVATGMHWSAARGEWESVLAGIITGTVLLFVFETPTWGMATGILVAYVVRVCGRMMRNLSYYLDVSLISLMLEIWKWPILASFLSAFLMISCKQFLLGTELMILWVPLIAGMFSWMICVYLWVLTPSHQNIIKTAIANRLKPCKL